ncbi:MAG: restriction endonuclease subunit S [Saprospiraceae bacterium]|nr:restriction endonuclease subunit S [Saprospiraceae bacterium]
MKRGWTTVKLGEVLKPSANQISVMPFEKYPQIGIRLWGEGVYAREAILGSETQYKYFYQAKAGDLTFNKIWVRNGAVAVISDELNDYYVSPEFPVYHPENSIVSSDWLGFLTKCKFFWDSCNQKAYGTSGKNRVKPNEFLQIEIPLPPLPEQQRIAARLQALMEKIKAVRRLRAEQEREMKNLLYSQYLKIIEGAKWLPMKEVAPLKRRVVDLQPGTHYSEIGVRSFGKGIFEKPNINADNLTWQKPYWIKEGDLLMSNIKAWEGAVAAVGKEHEGKVGSHRYLTFSPLKGVVSADFLWYYYMTDEGSLNLDEASPGSADRNRTLNTKKISEALVPVPEPALQNDFLNIRSKINTLQAAQSAQLSALEGLFPAVLEKAFKGEW